MKLSTPSFYSSLSISKKEVIKNRDSSSLEKKYTTNFEVRVFLETTIEEVNIDTLDSMEHQFIRNYLNETLEVKYLPISCHPLSSKGLKVSFYVSGESLFKGVQFSSLRGSLEAHGE